MLTRFVTIAGALAFATLAGIQPLSAGGSARLRWGRRDVGRQQRALSCFRRRGAGRSGTAMDFRGRARGSLRLVAVLRRPRRGVRTGECDPEGSRAPVSSRGRRIRRVVWAPFRRRRRDRASHGPARIESRRRGLPGACRRVQLWGVGLHRGAVRWIPTRATTTRHIRSRCALDYCSGDCRFRNSITVDAILLAQRSGRVRVLRATRRW